MFPERSRIFNLSSLGIQLLIFTSCYVELLALDSSAAKSTESDLDSLLNLKKFPVNKDYRDVIVHLNDWTYNEIKAECPKLREIGYAAVQISPVTAYAKSTDNAWDARFNVISYDFDNESGDEKQLEDMIESCKKVGIKVFADVVINNMARSDDVNKQNQDFKTLVYKNKDGRVLYQENDFHKQCDIKPEDYEKDLNKMDDCYNVADVTAGNGDRNTIENTNDQAKPANRNDYHGAIQKLKPIKDFFRTKRDKEGFKMVISLVDHTKREIVWSCWLDNRQDLKQVDEKERPLKPIQDLFRDLLYLGVSGFRILMADHMNPKHLTKVYEWLPRQPAFIYHDVYDPLRKESTPYLIKSDEYAEKTKATDYKYATLLTKAFSTRTVQLSQIYKLQQELGLLPSEDSVVFVNNFITIGLRNTGVGKVPKVDDFIRPGSPAEEKAVQLATAFMLSSNHGTPLITSSYTRNGAAKTKKNEHSIVTIAGMVGFRNTLKQLNNGIIPPPLGFKAYTPHQVSYCVGNTGFVVINNEKQEQAFSKPLDTCFDKDGVYCDVFGGGLRKAEAGKPPSCAGKSMTVTGNGKKGQLSLFKEEGFAAFHVEAMLPSRK